MSQTLINAQTAAAQQSFDIAAHRDIPAALYADGLGAGESVDLQVNIGGSWVDLYENGAQLQLTQTNNQLALHGPGRFRVDKGSTSAAVTVELSTVLNP